MYARFTSVGSAGTDVPNHTNRGLIERELPNRRRINRTGMVARTGMRQPCIDTEGGSGKYSHTEEREAPMEALLPLAEKIGARLKQRNETIGIAESSTGGLLSAALLSIGGASVYFRGGGVIYTAYARKAFLEIPNPLPAPIERASTEPYALLLADTIRARLDATWGLGETGATGPTGNRYGDKAGHSCIAVTGPGFSKVITVETGSPDRIANMRAFSVKALELLSQALG
jgi:nicotinamide-nucleotide amidase